MEAGAKLKISVQRLILLLMMMRLLFTLMVKPFFSVRKEGTVLAVMMFFPRYLKTMESGAQP
jgi:hypothetical protein